MSFVTTSFDVILIALMKFKRQKQLHCPRLLFFLVRSIGEKSLNAHCTCYLSCSFRQVLLLAYLPLIYERSSLLSRVCALNSVKVLTTVLPSQASKKFCVKLYKLILISCYNFHCPGKARKTLAQRPRSGWLSGKHISLGKRCFEHSFREPSSTMHLLLSVKKETIMRYTNSSAATY